MAWTDWYIGPPPHTNKGWHTGAYSDECQIEWEKDITMTLPEVVNDK